MLSGLSLQMGNCISSLLSPGAEWVQEAVFSSKTLLSASQISRPSAWDSGKCNLKQDLLRIVDLMLILIENSL